MKPFDILVTLILAAVAGNTQTLCLNQVQIIDVAQGRVLSPKSVLIRGDRIAAIAPLGEIQVPADATVVDGKGKYLMPGMVDAHIHFFQSGGLYTRPDAIDLRWKVPYEQEKAFGQKNAADFLKRYLRLGITTVADVGGPFGNFLIRDSIARQSDMPEVLVTGPLFSMIDNDYFGSDKPIEKVYSKEAADRLFQRLLPYRPDYIKIWYIAETVKAAEENYPVVQYIAERTRQAGLRLLVHATELYTARLAVNAGAQVLVHGIGDSLIPDDFIRVLRAKEVVVIPTLRVSNNYLKVFAGTLAPHLQDLAFANPFAYGSLRDLEHLEAIRWPPLVRYLRSQGIPDAMMRSDTVQAHNLMRMVAGGVAVAVGTDAGNIGTQHASSYLQELEAMHAAGMSAAEILRAATLHGAIALNRQLDYGTIQPGRKADLLLLAKNPLDKMVHLNSLTHVVKSGKIIAVDTLIRETPEAVVQRQLNAYNARNIEAFVATYAPDVVIDEWDGQVLLQGHEALRTRYTRLFEQAPNLHAEIRGRMVAGNKVIDQERVRMGDRMVDAIAIYEIEQGLIRRVTFVR